MSSYNPRERSLRGDKTLNAIVRCGQAVHSAVERFVTLGEALADDNVEIKVDMYEACRDARAAGKYTCFNNSTMCNPIVKLYCQDRKTNIV